MVYLLLSSPPPAICLSSLLSLSLLLFLYETFIERRVWFIGATPLCSLSISSPLLAQNQGLQMYKERKGNVSECRPFPRLYLNHLHNIITIFILSKTARGDSQHYHKQPLHFAHCSWVDKLQRKSYRKRKDARYSAPHSITQLHATPLTTTRRHPASRNIMQHHATSRSITASRSISQHNITQDHAAPRSITQHTTITHRESTTHHTHLLPSAIPLPLFPCLFSLPPLIFPFEG